MKGFINYIKEIILGVITLIKGMAGTGKYFITSPKTIVTQKYPENRKDLVSGVLLQQRGSDETTGEKAHETNRSQVGRPLVAQAEQAVWVDFKPIAEHSGSP